MPAYDIHHDAARSALIKDGGTITHDPLSLKWGLKDLFVDLGAERRLAAEKGHQEIAVEVKSFLGRSDLDNLEKALHGCLVHVDLIDGKFRIQRDGTERGIARDLEGAGIPKPRIVLGFRVSNIRKYTEYAVE